MAKPQLLDRWGRPVDRKALTNVAPTATVGSVRSPISGYPADGLNPVRLAQILREADHGHPVRYLELAETVEERDPHYLGVLGTRKRSVSQIDISIEAASDSADDVAKADMVREWLNRDELTEELFDILDAIGKGYSFTRIHWDSSEGQWMPMSLERWDQRWFRFDRRDLTTPMQINDHGGEDPLDPFGFIFAAISAKSGLSLRSGLARVAMWGWMFKAFTQRDWAIFAQTYGQPLRIGKFHPGASEAEKDTLFRAVANIAGDCAAIIPEGMSIDFVESKLIGASADLYEKRSDWLDRQISKAVLGQTATTDAIAGGHAVGQEHRQVQQDIERADCKALAAILNRDLIRPWIDLEYGPQKKYPRLKIERPEAEDLVALANALGPMIDRGLEVEQGEIRDKFKLSEPAQGAKILTSVRTSGGQSERGNQNGPIERTSADFKQGVEQKGTHAAENEVSPPTGKKSGGIIPGELIDQLGDGADPFMDAMLGQIESMLVAASSLDEFREMLNAAFPGIDHGGLARAIGQGLVVADLAGRVAVSEEDADG